MRATVTPELLELDKLEGKPLDVLRRVLDTLGVEYETPQAEEGDRVVYRIHGVSLDLFLEPDSVVFFQEGQGWTLITAIEQLTKVKCIAFRTQLDVGGKYRAKTDLINHPGTLEDRAAGRLLVRAKGKDLYLLCETKPGYATGQCTASVTIPNCLPKEYEPSQTLDIILSYAGENFWDIQLTGRIHTWNF